MWHMEIFREELLLNLRTYCDRSLCEITILNSRQSVSLSREHKWNGDLWWNTTLIGAICTQWLRGFLRFKWSLHVLWWLNERKMSGFSADRLTGTPTTSSTHRVHFKEHTGNRHMYSSGCAGGRCRNTFLFEPPPKNISERLSSLLCRCQWPLSFSY